MGRALKLTSTKAALIRLGIESLRSGTIASLVMMPFGFLFLSLGLRVGHYGPKLGEAIFGLRPMPWMQALLLGQHFVIGWLSALPLLLFWMWRSPRPIYLADGLVFGALYYISVNALALPWMFGDSFPWQMGWVYVYPSLVVHLVFGLSVALTARGFRFGHPKFLSQVPIRNSV